MSENHEIDILTFITLDGRVFAAPQFNIEYDKAMGDGGSCPDFLAVDLGRKEFVIVEVTTSADWKPLASRIKEREARWYKPVRRHFDKMHFGEGWALRFLGFVRQQNLSAIGQNFAVATDVAFFPIEKATFLWDYWESRMHDGLPR